MAVTRREQELLDLGDSDGEASLMRAQAQSAPPVAPARAGGALICLTHSAGGAFELLYRCGVYRDACPSRLVEAA